jgi:uncharacterized protein YceH (UPF0502 family)
MITLRPDECRVLGVLVEKALTTPAQYPLTLLALVSGCNQKSNRHPVTNLDEDSVLAALDSLRGKQLVREVLLSGSRVGKFRHNAREAMGVDTSELIILTELLLRGPQTTGELRGRASRMHPLESLDAVDNLLQSLIGREPPLVRRLPPPAGTRAATYAQLVCPDLHPTVAREAATRGTGGTAMTEAPSQTLTARVDSLEIEVAQLKQTVERLGGSQ